MEEKILNKMLDNLIEEAGPIAINNMVKDDLDNLDVPDVKFSKEHEEKMKQIFAEARKAAQSPSVSKPKKKVSVFKKFAVIAAAAVLISGLMISSVGAWRESFVKYFLDIKKEYSDVDERHRDTSILIDNVHFGYVPDGFLFEKKDINDSSTYMYFKLEEKYFILQINESKWNNRVNTESGEFTDFVINEKDMVYSENDGVKMLNWKENKIRYLLYTNESKETLLKIAEGIKIVE